MSADWLQLDRLAERWRDVPAEAPPPSAPAPVAQDDGDPSSWCARLAELAGERFAEGSVVPRLIAELGRMVAAGEWDGVGELVTQIEDLVDAAALRSPT
jgi:hypothetical protein